MRILYTLNSGNPGGMEQHVLDLVGQMILRGHEVYVWCCGGIIYDWYKKAGASVVERSIKHDIDSSYISDLKRFLNEARIDVVHSHELKAVANTLIAGLLAGTKVRISHQHTPFTEWKVSKLKKLIYNISYAVLVDLLSVKEIALTEPIKKIKMKAGILKRKLAVIPNGVDVYKFYVTENERTVNRREIVRKYHLDPEAKIIGNISRTSKEKGHDLLIRAFAKLISDNSIERSKYVLMICGGGDLEESLWTLAGELGIKDRLIITGRFDEEMKVRFYSVFDYFIFPTRAEGFGLVLTEALISGLPVLCSELPVLREVGGEYPQYFKTGDFEDLSRKMIELLEKKRDEGPQKNYIGKRYSLEKFGENYHSLYERLLLT